MKKSYWIIVLVIVVLVLGYLGRHKIKTMLGGSQTATAPAMQTETATPSSPDMAPTASSASSQTIDVSASEFAFSPSTISVKMGQPVTITFTNKGTYSHNLTIKDLNVATKTIQPGQSDTITFTPTKAGSFEYMCTVDSHATKGMTGTITVQ